MMNRRGVSLVEVLVASVLLAIGISGSLQALLASLRLRVDADAREAVVGVMLDRLAWFEAEACAGGDTSGVTPLGGGLEAAWRLRAVGSTRILELDAVRQRGGAGPRGRIVTSLPCD